MVFFLLPTLNEAESISKTLRGIHYQMNNIPQEYRIIVCDNGSEDRTVEFAENNGAIVTHEKRKGYGYTLMKGIDSIQKQYSGIENQEKILIFMDGDGQDSAENISVHLKNLDSVDFSIASRIKNRSIHSVSLLHSVANTVFAWALWIRTGKNFSDLGPFRALRMNTFLDLELEEYTYGWTAEMQKKIALKNISYIEFYSVPKIRHAGTSKVSGSAFWKQIQIGLKILWVICKVRTH